MKRTMASILAALGIFAAGCSTSARFIIPDNTELIVHGKRAVPEGKNFVVKTRPYFWSYFGTGIDYQLLKKDAVVRQGRLQAGFRFASIFWPPYALLYWPAGFSYDCYDLTKAVPVICERQEEPVKPQESTGTPWLTN